MARKASLQFKDRPIPPLEEAVYWMEYTLRYDTNFLNIPAVELTWYQYMLLDVALMVTLVVAFTIWLIHKLFGLLRCKQKSISIKKSSITDKKTK